MLCLKTKILLSNKLKVIRYIITLHVEKRREREEKKKKRKALYCRTVYKPANQQHRLTRVKNIKLYHIIIMLTIFN